MRGDIADREQGEHDREHGHWNVDRERRGPPPGWVRKKIASTFVRKTVGQSSTL
jgi:hypothetical protein